MTKKIKRIYVAGPLRPKGYNSQSLWIDYLLNVRNMVRNTNAIIKAGFIPFCPGIDLMYILASDDNYRPREDTIMRLSREWLEVCDALILTTGWQKSSGTLKEIEFAKKHGIPVFESIEDLKKYMKDNNLKEK